MTDPTYSIAVCNYNMAETIGPALESMLSAIDDRFEVLVVDDGSTDKSVDVVRDLQRQYESLRLVELQPDPDRELGQTRNLSVRESNGKYVLLQLDADDVYETGIVDFTEIYHQLEQQLDFQFYLKGNNINMAHREFLLELGPYRNLAVGGEDLDMWRRLFDREAIVWLDHDDISQEIGTGGGLKSRLRRSIRVKTAEFQTGISLPSYLRYGASLSAVQLCKYLVLCPVAYLLAQTRTDYDLPTEFRKKGALVERIERERGTLSELEERHNIKVDRSAFSDAGRSVYDDRPKREV